MKIIVNAGKIGNPVAVELAKLGARVTVGVRRPKPDPHWSQLGIRQVVFDIESIDSMVGVMKGQHAFLSVTPLVENLVEVGTKAVEAAQAAGIHKIVRSSALGAAADSPLELARMHYGVEKAVEDSGLPFTILRPALFMQNYLSSGIPDSIRDQSAFYLPVGDAKVSLIDTRDISAVAAKVLMEFGHEGKRYELTGGESLAPSDLADRFTNVLGRPIRYLGIPPETSAVALAKSGMPPWLVRWIADLDAEVAKGHFAATKPDLEMVLNREATRFASFVKDHRRVFQPDLEPDLTRGGHGRPVSTL